MVDTCGIHARSVEPTITGGDVRYRIKMAWARGPIYCGERGGGHHKVTRGQAPGDQHGALRGFEIPC